MNNPDCTKKTIDFKEGETIERIEGKIVSLGYVSQLTLFTTTVGGFSSTDGPFGHGDDSNTPYSNIPFSMVGSTVGFFGRSGHYLDAIGLYIDSSMPPTLIVQED